MDKESTVVLGALTVIVAASIIARTTPAGPLRRRIMAALAIILLLASYQSLGILNSVLGSVVIVLAVRYVEKSNHDPR